MAFEDIPVVEDIFYSNPSTIELRFLENISVRLFDETAVRDSELTVITGRDKLHITELTMPLKESYVIVISRNEMRRRISVDLI